VPITTKHSVLFTGYTPEDLLMIRADVQNWALFFRLVLLYSVYWLHGRFPEYKHMGLRGLNRRRTRPGICRHLIQSRWTLATEEVDDVLKPVWDMLLSYALRVSSRKDVRFYVSSQTRTMFGLMLNQPSTRIFRPLLNDDDQHTLPGLLTTELRAIIL